MAYHLPLRTLIRSLLNTTFDHYSDVLLLLGGNTDESPPISVKLSDVIPNLGGTDHEVVLVRTRSNAFDYHGLSLLYRYRTHPLVKAGSYVYLHDTTTVVESFVERFESFRLRSSPLLFTTWPLPNSNIVAFGGAVVDRYGRNFDGNLTKANAFPMEFGYPNEKGMRPLMAFGFVVRVGPRLPQGKVDVYGTGPRIRFFYPSFGVFKYSMRSDSAGDITGKRTSLFHGKRYFPPASKVQQGNGSKLAPVYFAQRPACWDGGCRERAADCCPRLMLPACSPSLWTGGEVSHATGPSRGG